LRSRGRNERIAVTKPELSNMSEMEEDKKTTKPEVMLVAEGKSTAIQHGGDNEANVFFKSVEWQVIRPVYYHIC
jgi:hypothetical protein